MKGTVKKVEVFALSQTVLGQRGTLSLAPFSPPHDMTN